MKILLIADNASMNFSGESALPVYYFDLFKERGHDVRMICHSRCREELRQRYTDDSLFESIFFIEENLIHTILHSIGKISPFIIRERIIGQLIYLVTQFQAKNIAKTFVKKFDIDVIHQPTPISAITPSAISGGSATVVIGPMCGGMEFPEAFSHLESNFSKISTKIGRKSANLMNRLIPGKRLADVLVVANDRTKNSLPLGCQGRVYEVIESGVDLRIWPPRPVKSETLEPTRIVYMARFVDQKGIPYLVEAFGIVAKKTNAILELIGDGELYEETQHQVRDLGINDRVNFHGWMEIQKAETLIRECDIYIVPAIRDCGGCAMLEAMAIGMPVIAANWAGPGQYADSSCGIVVDINTKDQFVSDMAEAMIKLVESPKLRLEMGEGSKARVRTNYLDWESKADKLIEIFEENLN